MSILVQSFSNSMNSCFVSHIFTEHLEETQKSILWGKFSAKYFTYFQKIFTTLVYGNPRGSDWHRRHKKAAFNQTHPCTFRKFPVRVQLGQCTHTGWLGSTLQNQDRERKKHRSWPSALPHLPLFCVTLHKLKGPPALPFLCDRNILHITCCVFLVSRLRGHGETELKTVV